MGQETLRTLARPGRQPPGPLHGAQEPAERLKRVATASWLRRLSLWFYRNSQCRHSGQTQCIEYLDHRTMVHCPIGIDEHYELWRRRERRLDALHNVLPGDRFFIKKYPAILREGQRDVVLHR